MVNQSDPPSQTPSLLGRLSNPTLLDRMQSPEPPTLLDRLSPSANLLPISTQDPALDKFNPYALTEGRSLLNRLSEPAQSHLLQPPDLRTQQEVQDDLILADSMISLMNVAAEGCLNPSLLPASSPSLMPQPPLNPRKRRHSTSSYQNSVPSTEGLMDLVLARRLPTPTISPEPLTSKEVNGSATKRLKISSNRSQKDPMCHYRDWTTTRELLPKGDDSRSLICLGTHQPRPTPQIPSARKLGNYSNATTAISPMPSSTLESLKALPKVSPPPNGNASLGENLLTLTTSSPLSIVSPLMKRERVAWEVLKSLLESLMQKKESYHQRRMVLGLETRFKSDHFLFPPSKG